MKYKTVRKIIGILFVVAMILNIMPIISISADEEELTSYTVEYDSNRADDEIDLSAYTTSYNDGDKVTVKDFKEEEIVLTKDGVKLSGWNTMDDGSGVDYDLLSEFDIHEDIKLYAQYVEPEEDNNEEEIPALGVNNPHEHNGITFTAWDSNNSMPTSPGSYYLTSNITMDGTWHIKNGEYNICLNDKELKINGVLGAIYVEKDGVLNLYDCGETGKLTNISPDHRILSGGLRVSGEFNMYGGRITGNNVYRAGGIYVENGKFNMYGGIIDDNFGHVTGGVYVSDGEIGLYGGEIKNNKCDGLAGGVIVSENSKIFISGDITISGNKKGDSASNLYLYGQSRLRLAGPLTNVKPIGITRDDVGFFTTDGTKELKSSDYVDHFKSDNGEYIIKAFFRELKLVKANIINVPADTVDPGISGSDGYVRLALVIEKLKADQVPENDLELSDTYMNDKDLTLGQYFDVSVYLNQVQIFKLNKPINITLDVPEEIKNAPDGYNRLFTVFKIHDGKVEKIKDSYDTSISFDTDSFSTYAIAYSDSAKPVENKPVDNNRHYSIPTTGVDH